MKNKNGNQNPPDSVQNTAQSPDPTASSPEPVDMTTAFDHLTPEEVLTEAYQRPALSDLEQALCKNIELLLNAYEVVCESVYLLAQEVETGETDARVAIASIKAIVEPDEIETVYIQ